MSRWKWIWRAKGSSDERLFDIGIEPDGSLHNPRGYPEEVVRAAILQAERRQHERRSEAAKKAAATRHKRQERKTYEAARKIVEGHKLGPRHHCVICGKGLSDTESIGRGIGSECWQGVLGIITAMRRQAAE
jgi:Family of unknown function (DUF6011)